MAYLASGEPTEWLKACASNSGGCTEQQPDQCLAAWWYDSISPMAQLKDADSPVRSLRHQSRWFLERMLKTSPDLDRFCLDFFEMVYRRFSGSMDRTARTNLLLEQESAQDILSALEQEDPTLFANFQIEWDRQHVPPQPNHQFMLGGYRLLHVIGRGAHATVYAAENISTRQQRAVKVLNWQLGLDPRRRQQFEQEARIIGKVNSQHAVQVIDSGVDVTGNLYLVMELLEGQTLADYLLEKGHILAPEILDILRQISHALSAAHRAGVVHRDLKPDNIFLCTSASYALGLARIVKVLDFGIAKLITEAGAGNTELGGTSEWMAPEQANLGATIGPATDLWPLGLLVFRMLVGHHYLRSADGQAPFAVVLREILLDPLPPASHRAGEYGQAHRLPPTADDWFARCICREPGKRFSTVDDAMAGLSALFSSHSEMVSNVEYAHYGPWVNEQEPSRTSVTEPLAPLAVLQHAASAESHSEGAVHKPLLAPKIGPLSDRQYFKHWKWIIVLTLAVIGLAYGAYRSYLLWQSRRCDQASLSLEDRVRACHSSCQRGNGRHCLWLAGHYSSGDGQPTDAGQAALFYQQACRSGEMMACYKIGEMRQNGSGSAQGVLEAAKLYRMACDGGVMLSCLSLGRLYEDNLGVVKDPLQAIALYRKACEGGEMAGCSDLGRMYEDGDAVDEDSSQAVRLYRKACDGGQMTGCSNLGRMYEDGQGVVQNATQAIALYRKACDGDEMTGCSNLGRIYKEGIGVARDAAKAVAAYRRACDGGELTGCSGLGLLLESGQGIEKDATQAIVLYRKACNGGEMTGCSNLGRIYSEGKDVARDIAQAVVFYRKACDGNEMAGCSNLGRMYEVGQGVSNDSAQAVALYRKACDGGEMTSCSNLGVLLKRGRGATRDAVQAVALYRKACDAGIGQSCHNLAVSYQQGDGIYQNKAEARRWFGRACNLGYQTACQFTN